MVEERLDSIGPKGEYLMRMVWNSNESILISILTILAFTVTNCAPVQIKNVVVQKADHYKFTLHRDGLRISVDPYTEESRLQDNFGCNLISRGILPVLIVVENQSAEDGYIIVTDKASLMIPDAINKRAKGDGGQETDEVERAGKGLNATTVTIMFALSIHGALALPLIPLGFLAEQNYATLCANDSETLPNPEFNVYWGREGEK